MPSFTQKFYSSDFHFGHRGILHHCAATRPFDSVEEMDAKIVDNINERVGSNDMLYILGDFALSGDADYVRHLFHAIHGRKILILGNHDLDRSGRVNKVIRSLPWDQPPVAALETTDDGCRLYRPSWQLPPLWPEPRQPAPARTQPRCRYRLPDHQFRADDLRRDP